MSAVVASPKLEITRHSIPDYPLFVYSLEIRHFVSTKDMSEASRIADQLRRAFDGDAWHGDSVLEILKGITAGRAATHPIEGAHSIWELVLHIAAWDGAVLRRLGGVAVELSDAENFPPVTDAGDAAWHAALDRVRRVHEELVAAAAALPDSRLYEMVPGKEGAHYTFYYMLHGVVQHELYHAGQIALLKKA
jgi:uncharacterized damage-inducible protein DinB